jgi:plastocyanin
VLYAQNVTLNLEPLRSDLGVAPRWIRSVELLGREWVWTALDDGRLIAFEYKEKEIVTHTVTASGTRFDPEVLTIKVGDCVNWVGLMENHNVAQVSAETDTAHMNGGFYSGAPGSRDNYTICFDAPQTYYYVCEAHIAAGMRGSIIVEADNDTSSTDTSLTLIETQGIIWDVVFHPLFNDNLTNFWVVHSNSIANYTSNASQIWLTEFMLVQENETVKAMPVKTWFRINTPFNGELLRNASHEYSINLAIWIDEQQGPILYITVGDMGVETAPQDANSLFGKILWLPLTSNCTDSVDGVNDFAGLLAACPQVVVWGLGVENPSGFVADRDEMNMNRTYFFFIDRSELFDEVNFGLLSGEQQLPWNFGYPYVDGLTCAANISTNANISFILPIAVREHMLDMRTFGGFVYRGNISVFADYYIFANRNATILSLSDFGADLRSAFVPRLFTLGECETGFSNAETQRVISEWRLAEDLQLSAIGTHLNSHDEIYLGTEDGRIFKVLQAQE